MANKKLPKVPRAGVSYGEEKYFFRDDATPEQKKRREAVLKKIRDGKKPTSKKK